MTGKSEAKIGRRGRAAVVVLGDIGRSPRMQYHALSLARQTCLEVDIVSSGGSDPHTAVLEHQSIHIHKMKPWPAIPRSLPKVLQPLMLLIKPLVQFLMLIWFLCVRIPAPDIFIVQNPPSVPTLVAVKWASWLRRSTFIVDWHNFGYTLLALPLGRSSPFVAVYRWFLRRTPTKIFVRESHVEKMGKIKDVSYEILNVLEFNSTRKQQLVICGYPDGRLVLYCKGADTLIYERLDGGNDAIKKMTRDHMEQYGSAGLRTLCLAYRDLSPDVYESWNEKFIQAKSFLRDREKKLDELFCRISKNLDEAYGLQDCISNGTDRQEENQRKPIYNWNL